MRSFLGKFAHDAGLILLGALLVAGTAVAAQMITGGDVKNGSLTGKDIKDGSLTSKDFKGSLTGATGPAGQNGSAGATGPAGTGGGSSAVATELVNKTTGLTGEDSQEISIDCPNGPVLSGGYVLHPSVGNQSSLHAVRSYAIDQDSWLVRAVDVSTTATWEISAVAVCAK